jgi:tripartite tricarboxylate transporter TctB family protein
MKDVGFGAALLLLSAGYYALAAALPETRLADAVGPDGLPKVYALLLASLSLLLLLRSLRERHGRGDEAATPSRLHPRVRSAAGMLAIGAGYVVLAPGLGYVPALAGLLFATAWSQRTGRESLGAVAIVSVCGAVFCWVLFVLVMGIPQPPGLWRRLL